MKPLGWVRWNGESLLPGPLGSVWQSQGGERRAQPPAPCLLPERLAPTTVEVEAGAEAEAAGVAEAAAAAMFLEELAVVHEPANGGAEAGAEAGAAAVACWRPRKPNEWARGRWQERKSD
jgi:hypothetical protein